MKLLILGAAGRVGSLLVEQALERDHEVIAFVHDKHDLTLHSGLAIVRGDVYNRSDLEDALNDVEVVISALGSWGTPKKDVLSVAAEHLVLAMNSKSISRIVSLTGADARDAADVYGVIHRISRILLLIFAGKVLRDGERHIALLRQSQLDWTVVRSPVMNSKPSSRGYELTAKRPYPWHTVDRTAVAKAMLDIAENDIFIGKSPFVVSNRRKA